MERSFQKKSDLVARPGYPLFDAGRCELLIPLFCWSSHPAAARCVTTTRASNWSTSVLIPASHSMVAYRAEASRTRPKRPSSPLTSSPLRKKCCDSSCPLTIFRPGPCHPERECSIFRPDVGGGRGAVSGRLLGIAIEHLLEAGDQLGLSGVDQLTSPFGRVPAAAVYLRVADPPA